VKGVEADEEMCRYWLERSVGLATVLNTHIGYDAAAKVAQRAVRERKSLPDVAAEEGILSPAQMEDLFDPRAMTEPSR
jgi:fumarate hydratase class II